MGEGKERGRKEKREIRSERDKGVGRVKRR